MTIQLSGPVIREGRTLEDFDTPFGDYLGAKFDEQWANNTSSIGYRSMQVLDYEVSHTLDQASGATPKPRLTQTEAAARAKEAGVTLDIPPDGIGPGVLGMLIDRKVKAKANADAVNRYQGGAAGMGSLTGFGVSLAAGLLDPLNYAVAFVPVVGEVRYSMMLAQASGLLGRAGIRAGIGALEGAVGTALLEPVNYAAHMQLQDDYKLLDSLTNIAFGGVMGGGLHVGAGAVRDAFRGPPRLHEPGAAPDALKLDASTALDAPTVSRGTIPEGHAAVSELSRIQHAIPLADEVGDAKAGAMDLARSNLQSGAYEHSVEVTVGPHGPVITDGRHMLAAAQELGIASVPVRVEGGTIEQVRAMIEKRENDRRISETPVPEERRQGPRRLGDVSAERAAQASEMIREQVDQRVAQLTEERRKSELGAPDGLERRTPSAAETIDAATFQQREAALRTAVAQSAQGRVPDVEGLIKPDGTVADIVETARRQMQPEAVRLASPEASRVADEVIAAAPKSAKLKEAESELSKVMETLEARGISAKEAPKEPAPGAEPKPADPDQVPYHAAMKAADDFITQQEEVGKAARAAALCDL